MQVNFRYSDTDFIAYLISIGHEYNNIEITRDKNKQLKAFVYFQGNKEDLIRLQNNYKNGLVEANILEFANNRKKMVKIIKTELLNHQINNLPTTHLKTTQ